MSKLSLDAVSRSFRDVKAVDAVSLEVDEGEFVTLLGPSGCGKTTTLRMVAGLEQNTGGRISISGTVVSDADRGVFVPPERRELGMVFQSYAIWPHMTVFENVAYPMKIRRRSREATRAAVEAALRTVEMLPYAARPATALSGGQQQRLAIARSLVFEPKMLLLDEPLSNLDAKLRTQMADEFRSLQRRLGITTLYVTHDQEEAMALSDRIVLMQRGRVLQIAAPQEIYERPDSVEVAAFFGTPNFLRGEITASGTDERGLWVNVRGEGWSGTSRAHPTALKGSDVLVMVRPENAVPLPAGAAAGEGIVFEGLVSESTFRGARRTATVTNGPLSLHVEFPALRPVRAGERLALYVGADAGWALPDVVGGVNHRTPEVPREVVSA